MFGFFKKPKSIQAKPPTISPYIDLAKFTFGDLKINHALPSNSPLAPYFRADPKITKEADYKNLDSGLEINVLDGLVICFFITLNKFKGQINFNGQNTFLAENSKESDVHKIMGEPFWTDLDNDGEVLDFYEFEGGKIEVQFEYPTKDQLSIITILSPGVLSNPKDRTSYQVTKSWPPTD